MNEILLFLHFVGLAMGVGTSFFMMGLGMASRGEAAQAGVVMRVGTKAANMIGSTGAVLLILSGIAMVAITPGLAGSTAFLIKMAAVVVLVIALGLIHMRTAQMNRTGTDDPGPLPIYSMLSLLAALVAMACAVIAFH